MVMQGSRLLLFNGMETPSNVFCRDSSRPSLISYGHGVARIFYHFCRVKLLSKLATHFFSRNGASLLRPLLLPLFVDLQPLLQRPELWVPALNGGQHRGGRAGVPAKKQGQRQNIRIEHDNLSNDVWKYLLVFFNLEDLWKTPLTFRASALHARQLCWGFPTLASSVAAARDVVAPDVAAAAPAAPGGSCPACACGDSCRACLTCRSSATAGRSGRRKDGPEGIKIIQRSFRKRHLFRKL